MYQALYRKYRPVTFSDVVGQEHITDTLKRQIIAGHTSHAYLFVGTRGCGKTSCAKILSRALNCLHPVNGDPCNECDACRGILTGSVLDVVEIDAASNNGVDSIRSLRDEAIYTPASVKKRVYIIDEVHMLSTAAFNALLKILEEPPEHLVFILATTELRKIPATILSRCQRFSFKRIDAELIKNRLIYVAQSENITLTDDAASLLSRLADGSMRDGLSLLERCAGSGVIDSDAVISAVGLSDSANTGELWSELRSGNLENALDLFEKGYRDGAESGAVLSGLLSLCRDMLLLRAAPKGGEIFITGALSPNEIRALSGDINIKSLADAAEIIQKTISTLPNVRDKRTAAEVCLVKLAECLSQNAQIFDAVPPSAPVRGQNNAGTVPKPVQRFSEPKRTYSQLSATGKPVPEDPPLSNDPPRNDSVPQRSADKPEPPVPSPSDSAVLMEHDRPAPDEAVSGGPPWDDTEFQWEPILDEPEQKAPAVSLWDDAPPPVYEPSQLPRTEPASATVSNNQTAGDDAQVWEKILSQCGGIDDAAMAYLPNPDTAAPEICGDTLVLHLKNAFVRNIVDTPEINSALTKSATAVLERAIKVKMTLEPLKIDSSTDRGKKSDKLDSLRRFSNVTFK